jgi:hypothetical protein
MANVGKAIVTIDDAAIKERVRGLLADAWDEGHTDGCIAAHCYMQRGQVFFDESKLTDCHTRNPYRDEAQA